MKVKKYAKHFVNTKNCRTFADQSGCARKHFIILIKNKK